MGVILSYLFCLVSPGVDVDCWLSLTRLPYSSVSYTRSSSQYRVFSTPSRQSFATWATERRFTITTN